MEQPKYVPYKVDSDQPEREFEVLENGDVKMTEVLKSVVYFHGREFISFVRQHQTDKESIEVSLSEESINKAKEEIIKLEKEVERLNPIMKDVEVKLKENYEKIMLEGKTKSLKAELEKKPTERNKGYAEAIWGNLKQEEKEKVMQSLTDDEKNEVLKLKISQKKKERRNLAQGQ